MNRGNHSKSRGSKALVLVLAMVLLMGAAIGGTIAWLTDKTDPVVNTFTVGNIDIDLEETDTTPENTDDANTTMGNSYKMIPGVTLKKDPKVTVYAGSEACWVFVKIEETAPAAPVATDGVAAETYNFADYITYTVDSAWTALPGHSGVYYIDQADLTTATENKTYSVIAGDEVTIPATVTKPMMDAITDGTFPKLTFTAYAIQRATFDDVADAWVEVSA